MGVRLSIRVRLGRAQQSRRRGGALVGTFAGTFAMLLQAVLFAWHNHPASFHVRTPGAVTTLVAPTAPVMPALADHDCEICFALSHHGAVPVDLFVANRPVHAPLRQSRLAAVDTSPAPYILFRSRAPPLA
jgi:hypothetical protein